MRQRLPLAKAKRAPSETHSHLQRHLLLSKWTSVWVPYQLAGASKRPEKISLLLWGIEISSYQVGTSLGVF